MSGGKRPTTAGLQIAAHGDVFGFTIRGDGMNYSGVQVTAPEDVKDARAIFEDRIATAARPAYIRLEHERAADILPT